MYIEIKYTCHILTVLRATRTRESPSLDATAVCIKIVYDFTRYQSQSKSWALRHLARTNVSDQQRRRTMVGGLLPPVWSAAAARHSRCRCRRRRRLRRFLLATTSRYGVGSWSPPAATAGAAVATLGAAEAAAGWTTSRRPNASQPSQTMRRRTVPLPESRAS